MGFSLTGGLPRVTMLVYNNLAATVARGDYVVIDVASTSSIQAADAIVTNDYGNPKAAQVFGIKLLDTDDAATITTMGGVAISDIPASGFGEILIFGYGLVKVTDADDAGTCASQATGVGYKASAFGGKLITTSGTDYSSAVANVPTRAAQVGTSGATTAGSLRLVFVHSLWGMQNVNTTATANDSNPLGAIVGA